MKSQFTFNNLKSYDDFQLTISELTIGNPSVNLISQTVPFMNGNYDFSSLYGGQTYSNREVKMVLFLNDLDYEGHDIWDIFNFEEDYAQQTSFTITNLTDIILYNPSAISITPTVICTSDMTVQMNDTTYKFVAGTTKDYRFKLAKGENHMTITGQGDIEFKFRKEVL